MMIWYSAVHLKEKQFTNPQFVQLTCIETLGFRLNSFAPAEGPQLRTRPTRSDPTVRTHIADIEYVMCCTVMYVIMHACMMYVCMHVCMYVKVAKEATMNFGNRLTTH